MKIDALGDGALLFSIPLNRAALLITLELGTFNGIDFTEQELAAYDGEINELLNIEPEGRIKQCRDFLLERLINSIERGELKKDIIRREINGTIVCRETWVDGEDLRSWTTTYGLGLDDYWEDYFDKEVDLGGRLGEIIESYRAKQAAWKSWKENEVKFEDLPEAHRDDYIRLLEENLKLKSERQSINQSSGTNGRLGKRAQDTLLKILAAIAYDCYKDKLNTPYSIAKDIQDAASQIGLTVSDDTIAARLKEALGMIDANVINGINRIRK